MLLAYLWHEANLIVIFVWKLVINYQNSEMKKIENTHTSSTADNMFQKIKPSSHREFFERIYGDSNSFAYETTEKQLSKYQSNDN